MHYLTKRVTSSVVVDPDLLSYFWRYNNFSFIFFCQVFLKFKIATQESAKGFSKNRNRGKKDPWTFSLTLVNCFQCKIFKNSYHGSLTSKCDAEVCIELKPEK